MVAFARDDDYVDDSFTTNNDVANEEEYMKGLEEENSDDDITSPGYSRVTATNQKDAKSAATNEEGAIGSAVEKGEATSKKDADIGEKELENDIDCRVTGVEIKEGTDMPNTVNGDEDDAVDNILTDTPVDAGVKATGTAEARTPVSSAQDGDDDTVAGGDAYILQFVRAARTDAELERVKHKRRNESPRERSIRTEEDSEDCRPLKRTRTSITNSVTTASAVRQQRARRRTKTFEAREKISMSLQAVVNTKRGLPKKSFKSWEVFEEVLKRYEAEYFLHFRVRSSEARRKNNRLSSMALLREVFTWTQKLRYLLSITRRTSIFFDSNRGAKYMSIPAKAVSMLQLPPVEDFP
ncbi:uncharacterized protein PITG_02971 [Phytophthora infestans T30-4]|uniref:Uncharacterized protein n=1 Tax=Phytophthora infestans (strain T30-4) TaxID=403677 RepID=D0MXM0_PHYIT|nr:uncharacterized protein PITG_02971 [Phytophthora infestans T30-4]EEY64383.1 conserved hypothetical protein [Phytophthora infestans T30-4]|eukprot:XP_002907819.1 conserved hypothetical protein [Phytophthora infestans T30-4]